MSNKFNINGSLTTTGDITVQGNLNIKGNTNTVNQETLSVKDNFISMNSCGTTLDASGMAGIITVTGKENHMLEYGDYTFDIDYIMSALEIQWEPCPDSTCVGEKAHDIVVGYNKDFYNKFQSLNLSPIAYKNSISEDFKYFNNGGYYEHNYGIMSINDYTTSMCVVVWDAGSTFVDLTNNTILRFENALLKESDIEFLSKFLKKLDGTYVSVNDFYTTAQAYASPIYDTNSDTLRIGLGSYTKDDNGNITGFTFGAGQGQSIATRADSIKDGNLIEWSSNSNKLVDAGISAEELTEKIDSALALNLENGTVVGSLQQKGYDAVPGAIASGAGSVAFGGKRYDKLEDIEHDSTSAEGVQSLAGGGSSHAYGDWSLAFGKDAKAYQKASVSLGGSTIAGNPDRDPSEYSFAFAVGEATIAKGRGAAALNSNTSALGSSSFAFGNNTTAKYDYTTAGGYQSQALAAGANVIGWYCKTGEIADGKGGLEGQFVTGIYNSPLSTTGVNRALFIVGNGKSDTERSNALVVKANGNVEVSATSPDTDKDLVTYGYAKKYFSLQTAGTNSSCTANANNSITSAGYGLAIGYSNNLGTSNQSALIGYANKMLGGYQGACAIGTNLQVNANYQTVIGTHNEPNNNTIFVVGNGTKDQKKNIFEVLKDGRAKVYGAPTEDNDVVRNIDLQNTIAELRAEVERLKVTIEMITWEEND